MALPENTYFFEYLGTYGDIVATSFSDWNVHLDMIYTYTIAGCEFVFGSSEIDIKLYDKTTGEFYSFLTAYEKGLLTKDDIEQIYVRRNNKNVDWKGLGIEPNK